jgi:hypothetical protein
MNIRGLAVPNSALKVAVLLLLALCQILPTEASIISLPNVFSPGQILTAAELNANYQTIYNDYNGNITNANLAAAAAISLTKLGLNPGGEAFNQVTSSAFTWSSGLTTDSEPEVAMTANQLQLGPGGTTAPDVALQRTATNTVQINNTSTGAATLDMNGGKIINVGGLSGSTSSPAVGGRLYLTTGAPYASSNGSGTLLYGPAVSNTITLFNGSAQIPQTFAETSFSLGSLSSGVYDIYVSSLSGTTIAISSVAWSGLNTPPTRGTDSYGRPCKSGTPTALFVGAIYVNSSTQSVDNTSERFVSNLYNSISRPLFAADPAVSWTNPSSGIPAPADGNTTDGVQRFSFVQCVSQSAASVVGSTSVVPPSTGNYWPPAFGIGINSTSVATVAGLVGPTSSGGAGGVITVNYNFVPSPGFTYIQNLVWNNGSSATYWGVNTSYNGGGSAPLSSTAGTVFN